ncbi:MAG: hypothetical protein BGO41_01375 [Clostridiales bacterium 38-18]|mgnify:FL=1|nr:MAG: hypothetical protein BGO41_01375 [Clostridiales bacterium 38-18]
MAKNNLSNLVNKSVKSVNDSVLKASSSESLIILKRDEFLEIESMFPDKQKEYFSYEDTDKDFLGLEKSVLNIGIIHPPTLKMVDGKYKMITGHRKQNIVRRNPDHFEQIDCIVTTDNEEVCYLKFLDSNVEAGREKSSMDLVKIFEEEKEVYKQLAEKTGHKYNINKEIAENTGKSKKTVERYLNVTNLIPEFREIFDKGEWSVLAAQSIGQLNEYNQKELFNIFGESLSKKTELEIKTIKENLSQKTDELVELEEKVGMLEGSINDKEKEIEQLNMSLEIYTEGDNSYKNIKTKLENANAELFEMKSNQGEIIRQKAEELSKNKFEEYENTIRKITADSKSLMKKLDDSKENIALLSSIFALKSILPTVKQAVNNFKNDKAEIDENTKSEIESTINMIKEFETSLKDLI